MREPAFWWRPAGLEARLLAPLAAVYGAVASARFRQRGYRARTPVICIGNPTVGGAGKTPMAIAVTRMLIAAGAKPMLLSRGYGGEMPGPVLVDPSRHRAAEVGDEALLLARTATTIIARDRAKGAEAALAAGAGVIVMDDGFQNPSLTKDFSILVLDARRGLGNGRVIPAGPLRAPIEIQLERAHALVIVGPPEGELNVEARARVRGIPVFRARLEPDPGVVATHRGSRVLAFAGIGDPEKFFATLAGAGVAIAATRSFPDHHRYSREEARALLQAAEREHLSLMTTEKDLARMQGDVDAAELAGRARALPVVLVFNDEARFAALLRERLVAARAVL